MFYQDLSSFPKGEHRSVQDAQAVGWLSSKHPYSKGQVSADFVDKLLHLCCNPAIHSFGYHICEFCNNSQGVLVNCGSKQRYLGSAGIIVFNQNNSYVAPNLIYHYVVEHQYCPPGEFIQAVLELPLPESQEYQIRLRSYLYG